MLNLTLCTHTDLEHIGYGAREVWENDSFTVLDGNHGQYLIVRGVGAFDGLTIRGTAGELEQFKNCGTDESRLDFLWALFARLGGMRHLPHITAESYQRGRRDGANDLRAKFHVLLGYT